MAAVIDVSEGPLVSLDEAVTGRRRAARARLFKGGQPIAPRPMLWPCPHPPVEVPHREPATAALPADVHVIRGAVVGGGGSMPTQDGRFVQAWTAYPPYIAKYLEAGLQPETWAYDRWRLKTWRIPRAFALAHFNLMWGHWLLEVFPKLFAIRELNRLGVAAPILLPANAPEYALGMIEDVLPGQQVIVYDPRTHKVNVGRLILPPMLQHLYHFHPAFGAAVDAYAGAARRQGSPRRLFVSRAGLKTDWAYRELENEAEIEAAAAGRGFAVTSPERLPWREQLALFAGAEVIAGEFGSGLHNTLFSPRGAKVVALNWIGDTQSRLTNFREQDVGYILPDDGEPRVFHMERALQRYRIDPAEFGDRLDQAIEAEPPQ
jgi:O-antigen biosynthesis protein WbqL